jgi:hypothetical protein
MAKPTEGTNKGRPKASAARSLTEQMILIMNDLSNSYEQIQVEKRLATLSSSKALTTYRHELYLECE